MDSFSTLIFCQFNGYPRLHSNCGSETDRTCDFSLFNFRNARFTENSYISSYLYVCWKSSLRRIASLWSISFFPVIVDFSVISPLSYINFIELHRGLSLVHPSVRYVQEVSQTQICPIPSIVVVISGRRPIFAVILGFNILDFLWRTKLSLKVHRPRVTKKHYLPIISHRRRRKSSFTRIHAHQITIETKIRGQGVEYWAPGSIHPYPDSTFSGHVEAVCREIVLMPMAAHQML
jgi:hypothetical protein